MAKEYGKLPIDILFPDGNYSNFESQMFNLFVLNIGTKKENEMQKSNAMRLKRR